MDWFGYFVIRMGSATVRGFLKSWLFRGFLWDDKFWWETGTLVWFYALDCFGFFCLTNGHFLDFLNYRDSID